MKRACVQLVVQMAELWQQQEAVGSSMVATSSAAKMEHNQI